MRRPSGVAYGRREYKNGNSGCIVAQVYLLAIYYHVKTNDLRSRLLQVLRMSLLRKPTSVLAAMCRTTEFSAQDLRRVLTRISPENANQAFLDIQRGTRPLLGTIVSLLSETNDSGDSDLAFLGRAYEKLVGQPPNGQLNLGHALVDGFLSRAEVVQRLIASPQFEQLLEDRRREPDTELADLGQSEALLIDRIQRIFHPHRLLPPAMMRWKVGQLRSDVYGRHFENIGRHFQAKLVRDGGLREASRVLDVGSGCGRIAIPLTEVISESGLYIGLEIDEPMVQWCQRNISACFPQFRFIHCPVQNSAYNPHGRERPEQYKFPFGPGQFDLIIATSVFTHLRPASASNYIFECARVLRPGGKLFATAFLIENGLRSPDWGLKFEYVLDEVSFTTDPNIPEAAVAYSTDWLLDNFRRAHLEVAKPIYWGSWSGKQPAYSGQDLLILEKQG